MFRIIEGNTQGFVAVDRFVDLINDLPPKLSDLFDRDHDIFVSRAPGRLDVMGGIADYSGSLVLPMPIAEATFAAVQKTANSSIRVASMQPGSLDILEFEMDLRDLADASDLDHYERARKYFQSERGEHWASYVVGVYFVLRNELGVDFHRGARILISSSVPIGKGVSSSAALEVATMSAVCSAYDIDLDARSIALLCQRLENNIVGAPCGVMDQIAVCCGTAGSLISLLCQPADIQGTINISEEIEFWGIDSGVRHSVAGADYSTVRAAAFMGYRMIADGAGLEVEVTNEGPVKIIDERWGGYLANVSPNEYERDFASTVPTTITGDEFLERYGGTTDVVSEIDRSFLYQVKAATEHAIYESSRVRKFADILSSEMTEENLGILGELMFASHQSYAACGLTEPRTDRIVELVRENRSLGLYGARITGGGSGGTVVILSKRDGRKAISKIREMIKQETGERPYLFSGSSPGASAFGRLRLSSIAATTSLVR